jgi:hypothetical protein
MHLTPHVATMDSVEVFLCVHLHVGAEIDLLHWDLVFWPKMPVFIEFETGTVKIVVN